MRINQNIMALNAYRNLSNNEMGVSKSLEKLSSGTRINRAADDASGLVISQGLRSQIGGLNQATRNAQDGISVVQTAEGALNEVHTMLGRMRDLAVQANNTGSNDTTARTAAQKEVTELTTEINRLADTTKFGSTKLLDGSYGTKSATTTLATDLDNAYTIAAGDGTTDAMTMTVTGGTAVKIVLGAQTGQTGAQLAATIQTKFKAALAASANVKDNEASLNVKVSSQAVGAGSAITVEVGGQANAATFALTSGTLTTSSLGFAASSTVTATVAGGATFQVGADNTTDDRIGVVITDTHTSTLFSSSLDLVGNAGGAIGVIDAAIATVSGTRADLGAKQNRLESVISNLQVATENLSSSESRIRDTDYAQEMVKFTRGQILNQAATSMLGQANKLPQSVLSLLQG